jgi:tRNA nucleotidyltransferase/poly(A) polymerase
MRVHRVDWYHHLPAHVKEIILRLQTAGKSAFVAGGAVRDLLLGVEPKDFDLVSDATPEEIASLFPKTLDVGKQFGIMVVITEGGPVEVARFRSDGMYADGRHPTAVAFASPEEDAKRRDFTINALFYDSAAGEIIDYVDGLPDIERKIIRCVGDPKARFEEDALRMMRAIRFQAQLDFTLSPDIVSAIRSLAGRLSLVSRERITQELDRIFLSEQPLVGLAGLVETGLWPQVFDVLEPEDQILKRFGDLGPTYMAGFQAKVPVAAFYGALSIWIHGIDLPQKLVLPKETKALFQQLPDEISRLRGYPKLELADRKLALASPNFPIAWTLLTVEYDTAQGWLARLPIERAEAEKSRRLNPPPLLGGKDLIELGIPAGPEIKKLLALVRREQLNERISTREQALACLVKLRSK